MHRIYLASLCLLVALLSQSLPAIGQEIEVIFSEVPGHATAQVPGALDPNGQPLLTEFKAFEDLVLSPDGSQWIVKARNTGSDQEQTMLLLGSGTTGTILAQEGQPVHGGEVGELYDFFDPIARFNDLGHFAFGARARDGNSAIKEKVIKFDGAFSIVVTEGVAAMGLQDLNPDPSGDELFGNSLNSIHILNDGRVGFAAITIQNIHSSRRPALFYDDQAFLQSGVSAIDSGTWDSFDSNKFFTTPDGLSFLAQGDDEGGTTTDDILVVNNSVVLREGSVIPGSGITVAAVFDSKLGTNGDWYSRGDDPNDNDWAVRTGVLIAATGDPIFPGATENWADIFLAFNGNTTGSYVLVGNTDSGDPATDQVVVMNGEEVVVREGDPVDLDGNGMFDDDAFIGRGTNTSSAFAPNDFFLTDDHFLYFFAPLRNGAGQDLGSFGAGGEAFLRLKVAPACSRGNLNLGGGGVENSLSINGSVGGVDRTVIVPIGNSLTISMASGSNTPVNARYVVWVWPGAGRNPTDLMALGSVLGCSVNPTPVNPGGTPQPIFCLPGQGIPGIACGSASIRNVSNFAPWSVTKPTGLQSAIQFTFQGILEDTSSAHPSGFSMTNAVTLVVE